MEKIKNKPIKTEFSVMLDFLFVILILIFMSMVNYGIRPLYVFLVSVISSYFTDLVCLYLRRKKFDKKDLSAIVSGGIIALMLPATISYSIVIFTNIFAIIIGKQIFGGRSNMIFNSSAVGVIFSSICWKNSMLTYPMPNDVFTLTSDIAPTMSSSLTNMLSWATIPSISDIDLMLGKFPGPMGATHIIVLLACGTMLIFRKSISPSIFFSGGISIALLAYILPVFGNSRLTSVYYEMISGMTIFALTFLASDFYTSPKLKFSGILYGIILGIITSIFRHIGIVENAIVFAVIVLNPFSDAFDSMTVRLRKMLLKSNNKIKTDKDKEQNSNLSEI